MVMVPVVVVAVRTVFIFIILLNLFSSVYAEDIFVFSEIGSGIKIENQFEEEIDSDFFTTFFTEAQTPSSRFSFAGGIFSIITLDTLSVWQMEIVYEKLWGPVNIASSVGYQNKQSDKLDAFRMDLQLFRQSESFNNFLEYGFLIRMNDFLQNKDFSNFEINSYFLYKKFLKNYTVHHEFNIASKHYLEINSLFAVNYQIKFSFPTSDLSGMSVAYFCNYNLRKEPQLIYPDEELFDLFSYDMHKLLVEYTQEKGNILFKPWFALVQKKYLPISVIKPYSEVSIIAGFYTDWLFTDGFMAYAEGFYQVVTDESEDGYEFSTGMKMQFDILER